MNFRLVFLFIWFSSILVVWFLFPGVESNSLPEVESNSISKPQEISMPTLIPYVYPIREIVAVHDGDTITVIIDLGFDTYRRLVLRVNGIDTPEVTGSQKVAGLVVRNAVIEWLKSPKLILESKEVDKYGRSLAEIYNANGVKLSSFLLSQGLARPYWGEKRLDWDKAFLDSISDRVDSIMDAVKISK